MNTLVSEVYVCLKVTLIVQLSASPVSSVVRASDFKPQVCGFESHCEQEFYFFNFVAFNELLAGRLVPYK